MSGMNKMLLWIGIGMPAGGGKKEKTETEKFATKVTKRNENEWNE